MAGAPTTYGANSLLSGVPMPTTLYVKFHTGNPGAAATSNASADTRRAAFTRSAAQCFYDYWKSTTTLGVGIFGLLGWGASETLTHVSLWDASTGGNPWWVIPLDASITINSGEDITLTSIVLIINHVIIPTPTLVGVGANGNGGSSHSNTYPTGIQAGDYALIHANSSNGNANSATGFTSLLAGARGTILGKVMAGTESSTSITVSHAGANGSSFISVWRGVDTASPVAASAAGANVSSGNMTYPSITPGINGAMFIAQGNGLDSGGGAAIVPSGTNPTFALLQNSVLSARVTAFYGAGYDAAAIGARDVGPNGFTNFYNGLMLALKPA